MTLEGTNVLQSGSDYSINTVSSSTAGNYCAIIPNQILEATDVLMDLHKKSLFDELSKGTKSKEEVVANIEKEYNDLKAQRPNLIIVFPMMDEEIYKNIVNSADKQKLFDLTKNMGAITNELYKKITDTGIESSKINKKIIMIEATEEDHKLVAWLKEQMPSAIDGIEYTPSSLAKENPFMSGNMFATSSVENTNPFISDTPQNIENVPQPTPVQNVDLEGTTTFSAIPSANNNEPNDIVEEGHGRKANGFVNLAALLVIVIVVTFISIEFGKYLYSIYGV